MTAHKHGALLFFVVLTVRAGSPVVEYSTSFEPAEGYSAGAIHGQQGWVFLNATNSVSAYVASSLGREGAQSLVLSNAYLATEYTFKLRRAVAPFSTKGLSVASSLYWTPLSGNLSSKAGWGMSSGGSDYFLVRGEVYTGGSWIGVRHNSLETSYSSTGTGVNPAYNLWSGLTSFAHLSKTLPTEEIVSTFSNVLSNTGGRCIFKNDAWVRDVNFTATWIDIQVAVKPQSSVALDSFSYSASYDDNNASPTDIFLSNAAVAENQPAGTAVGTLTTADPDTGDSFTYSLVAGAGSTDNAAFSINGNALQTAASFNYEARNVYSVRLRTTDQGGLLYEKAFTITVTDVIESCVVTFNAAGGTVSPANKVVTVGAAYGVLPTPMRTGHMFSGWWTGEAGAGTEVTAATAVASASNHTIFAKWSDRTSSSPVPVPYLWLDQFPILLQVACGNYEIAALIDPDLDGQPAWQEYVAGTVPTDRDSVFRINIDTAGGSPLISWMPDLRTARVYTVEGKTNLTDAAWGPTNAGSRFFRVRAAMP